MKTEKNRPCQSFVQNNGLANVFRFKRRTFWSRAKGTFYAIFSLLIAIILAPYRFVIRIVHSKKHAKAWSLGKLEPRLQPVGQHAKAWSLFGKSPSFSLRKQTKAWSLKNFRVHALACLKKQTKVCSLKTEPTLQGAKHAKAWSLKNLRAQASACLKKPAKPWSLRFRYPIVISIIIITIVAQFLIPERTGAATKTWDMSDSSIYDNASGKLNFNSSKASITSPGSANGSAQNLNPTSGVTADGSAQFTSANKDYLTINSNASLVTGDIDFEIGAWVYLDSKTANTVFISKGRWGVTGTEEYNLDFSSGTKRFRISVSSDGTSGHETSLSANTLGEPSSSTWYFIRAWHDSVNNTLNIKVNAGATDSVNYSSGVYGGADAFVIGAVQLQSAFTNYMNGRIDSAYFKKSISSTDEATALYNSGSGRTYADLTAANGLSTFQTNLTSWWDLNEESGTRMDSKGTNHLTSVADQLINPTTLNGGFETRGTNGGGTTNIQTATRAVSGNVATIVTAIPHNLVSTNVVNITSMTDATYNATGKVVTVTNATTFTYSLTHADEAQTADTAGRIATDVFANWTENPSTNEAPTINLETSAPYAGSNALRIDVGAASRSTNVYQSLLVIGKKYKVTLYAKSATGTPNMVVAQSAGGVSSTFPITTSYAQYTVYLTPNSIGNTNLGVGVYNVNSNSIYIDNFTLESIGPLNAAGIAGTAPSEGNFAAQFNGTSQYLSKTSNASLQTGNIDFEFGAWIYADRLGGQDIISKAGVAGQSEYSLFISASTGQFRFTTYYDGTNPHSDAVASSFGTVAPGTWNFVRCWHNASTQMKYIQVNNGTANGVSTASHPGVFAGNSNFLLGKTVGDGYFSGRLDSVYFRKAISSTDEATALYNNGKGVKYLNAPATMKADVNLISWWDLDERSGTRNDSVVANANNLSDNGTVTQGQGVGYFDGAVGKWTDLSAGNSYTQTTQTYKPTYSSTDLNGHPGVLFDGVDDKLVKTGDQIGTGNVTAMAVIKPVGWGGGTLGRIFDNTGIAFYLNSVASNVVFGGASTASSANSSISLSNSYIISVTRASSGATNIYINGTLSGTADQPSSTSAGSDTYIGNRADGTRAFDGYLGPILTYSSILGSVERNQVEQTLGAKYGISVATAAGTASSSIYPTLSTKNPQYYASISSFSPSFDAASTGTLRYQLSNDPTANSIASATWYYWSGAAWATADKYNAYQSNTAADISTNINTFYTTVSPGGCNTVKWRAFFITDGVDNEILNSISSTYVADPDPPTNPTTWAVNMGGTPITNASWINTAGTANFVFSGATDPGSGVTGYYIYFGTSSTADPVADGSYQAHSGAADADQYYNATIATGDDGKYQYLRIVTRDKAGNLASAQTKFEFGYDKTLPTRPLYVASDPAGYTTVNSYTMTWPAGTDPATAYGASGIKWYEYKRATDLAWSHTADAATRTVAGVTAYQEGANAFYVRTVDNAGNISADYQQTTYYYSGAAPAKPSNLAVTPNPADTNNLTISWDKPTVGAGDPPITGYWYSINATPTVNNTTWVASTADHVSIGPDAYATQQGVNTVYVLSQNEAGNKSYESSYVASATFSCVTAAPPIPTSVNITDTSDKIYSRWMLTLQWLAGAGQDPATFDHYAIERSTDGVTFAPLATTVSTAYIDASGLNNTTTYYYRVKAVDNAGSTSAASSIVSKMPAGKYSTPPTLLANPSVEAKVSTATVTWSNNRNSSSFVRFGTSPDSFSDSKGQIDAVTNHTVTLTGLNPATTYYYQVQSLDEDREYSPDSAYSTTFSFTTQTAPAISNVQITNLTLSSADISWQTTTVATSVLNYGPNTFYGTAIDDQSGTGGTTHNVKISGLNPSSIYHFKITGQDSDGNLLTSDDYAFSTLAIPEIESLKIEPITDKATLGMRVTWETNVETTTIVKYYTFGISREYVSTKMEKNHIVELTDLTDNSDYMVTAQGRDQFGNLASAETSLFKTPYDTRPPIIYDIIVETNNVGVGAKDTAQIAVSWKTDEPATSQVEYGDGLSGASYTTKTNEDATLTESHLVIITGLKPNSPYHLRVVSKDKGNNIAYSDDHAAIVGEVPKSTLQIILQTLSKMFGWMTR